jgi:hypothetical protein
VQENQVGPKLNGLLTYAIDVNLLENNIWVDTIQRDTDILIYASKEVGLEIKVEKTKYMLLLVIRTQVKIMKQR